MGKKYIIELEDKPFHKEDGDFLYRAKGFNSLVFDMTGISKLAPYTEPDLEQMKEAFEKGYGVALDDLWKAMQKAIKMYCEIDNEVFLRVFHDVKCDWGESVLQALFKNTPQHLIDSIRQYEQAKEAKQHTWIFSEVNEPSVDTTLICSECGYTITIKPGDTQALNFCPKCGDNKRGEQDE